MTIFILFLTPLTLYAQSEKPFLNSNQLIEEALQNNAEISAAKIKWEVLKEKIAQAHVLEDPLFGFGIIKLPAGLSFKYEDLIYDFNYNERLRKGVIARSEATWQSHEIASLCSQ